MFHLSLFGALLIIAVDWLRNRLSYTPPKIDDSKEAKEKEEWLMQSEARMDILAREGYYRRPDW